MKNIAKVALIALAFVLAGCAAKPAPAPQEPVMTPAPAADVNTYKAHKYKHHGKKRHHKDKLGTPAAPAKDTAK